MATLNHYIFYIGRVQCADLNIDNVSSLCWYWLVAGVTGNWLTHWTTPDCLVNVSEWFSSSNLTLLGQERIWEEIVELFPFQLISILKIYYILLNDNWPKVMGKIIIKKTNLTFQSEPGKDIMHLIWIITTGCSEWLCLKTFL